MKAESIHEKALRLIGAGAVTIRFQGDNVIDADVHGDHDSYPVVIEIGDRERCWCRTKGDCSHLLAVLAVALQRNTGLPPVVTLGKVGV